MSRILPTLAATTALALATFAVPAISAHAAQPFDGTWVIDVPSDTISGGGEGDPTCPALRLVVQVTDGQLSGNFKRSPPEESNVIADGGNDAELRVAGNVRPDGAVNAQWQNFHANGRLLGPDAGLTVESECGPLQATAWRLNDQSIATASSGGSQTQASSSTTRQSDAYNVYFRFDMSNLTPEAQQVVTAAVSSTRADQTSRIVLVGKADLSGTDPYNMALSHRRADTVRHAMVAGGVPKDRIDERWVGDREPPVPTAAGVRDAQNRVVEVAIH